MEEKLIRAIIIDDEERARKTLLGLLEEFCPEVEVIAQAANVPEGVLAINKHRPDLVFLDIEMPEYNGFELLGFFREIDFEFIFVTAYHDHALRAFEVSAVDYLLKPVEIGLLQAAVAKAGQRRHATNMRQRLEVFQEAFKGEDLKRIALNVNDGLIFVELADIVLLNADGAYTQLQLCNGTQFLVSKKLRLFEEILLHRPNFIRPHRSHIININYLKKYRRGENLLILDNGASIPVAREKKAEFEQTLKDLRIAL